MNWPSYLHWRATVKHQEVEKEDEVEKELEEEEEEVWWGAVFYSTLRYCTASWELRISIRLLGYLSDLMILHQMSFIVSNYTTIVRVFSAVSATTSSPLLLSHLILSNLISSFYIWSVTLCSALLYSSLLHTALPYSSLLCPTIPCSDHLCYTLRCCGDFNFRISSTLLFLSFLSFHFPVLQNVKIATYFCFVALILLLYSSLHATVHAVVWGWGCVSAKRYPQTHTNIPYYNQSNLLFITALHCTGLSSYHIISCRVISYHIAIWMRKGCSSRSRFLYRPRCHRHNINLIATDWRLK